MDDDLFLVHGKPLIEPPRRRSEALADFKDPLIGGNDAALTAVLWVPPPGDRGWYILGAPKANLRTRR